MRFFSGFLLMFLLLCMEVSGQKHPNKLHVVRTEYGGYVYKNENDKVVINNGYYHAYDFPTDAENYSGSLAPVQKDTKGYNYTYDYKWAFINVKGEEVTGFIYDDITMVKGGYLVSHHDSVALMDYYGVLHSGFVYAMGGYNSYQGLYNGPLPLKHAGKIGAVDINGNMIIPFIYDSIVITVPNFQLYQKQDSFYLFNKAGKFLCWSESGYDLEDSRCIVQQNGSHGIIDTNGLWVLEPRYKLLQFIEGDKYIVASNGYHEPNQKIFDKEGKLIFATDLCLSHPYLYNENKFWVEVKDSSSNYYYTGMIDKNSKVIISPIFRTINEIYQFPGQLMAQDQFGNWGIIDTLGRIIVPFKFGQNFDFDYSDPFHALTTFNNQNVVINSAGDILFEVPGRMGSTDGGYMYYENRVFVFGDFISHHHYTESIDWAYSFSGKELIKRANHHHQINVSSRGLLHYDYDPEVKGFTMSIMDTLGNQRDPAGWDGIGFSNKINGGEIIICINCVEESVKEDFETTVFYKGGQAAIVTGLDSVLVPRSAQGGFNQLLLKLMQHTMYDYHFHVLRIPRNYLFNEDWLNNQLKRMKKMSMNDFIARKKSRL